MEDQKSDLQQDKPRRLEDETADYLAKIEQQFTDNLDREEKLNLVENVLSEINQRTASAACDRRTNYLIEKLCFAADIKNLLIIARRFAPYSLFLARNRYSSHILQAILSRMCYVLKFDDYGDVAPEYVIETMQEICTPVMKEASWLILEQSASHVVRSMLSLLAGLPVIAERKGKNSKHQHSIALSEPLDALIEPGLFYISSKAVFPVPSSFHDILICTVENLLKLGTKELERLIADFSSSAVLGLLIRILSNPDLLYTGNGRVLAARLFCAALGWKDCPPKPTPEVVPEGVQAVFYAMAGDRAGSYFLEALIECSAPSFLTSIVGSTIVGKCKEYVEDGSGNFVLQAILRRISCELPRWSGSEAKQLISIAVQVAEELIQSDYFTHVVNFKGGVVLWLLAVVNGLPASHSDLCEKVGEKVLQAWVDSALVTDDSAVSTTSASVVAKTLLAAIPALPSNPTAAEIATHRQQQLSAVFSSKLLPSVKGENVVSEQQPAGGRGGKGKAGQQPPVDPRDTTQLLVARVIGALLKNKAPEVAQLTIKAFAHLTPEALKYVATSGAVSRAVLDVFFEVTAQTAEFKIMGINLAAIGVELAGHYVGQHIVRQSFDSADLRGKEKWALTLSNASAQLSRTKEGTASLRLVNAELYQRDATEWRSTIKRKLKAESLLKELEAPVPPVSAAASAPSKVTPKQSDVPTSTVATSIATKRSVEKAGIDNEEGSDTEAAGQAGGEKTGRKRKRKRPNKANIV